MTIAGTVQAMFDESRGITPQDPHCRGTGVQDAQPALAPGAPRAGCQLFSACGMGFLPFPTPLPGLPGISPI